MHRVGDVMMDAILHSARFSQKERELTERTQEFLSVFNLHNRQAEIARNLPYGEQRRLEIARALATKPDAQVNVNYIGSFSDVALAAEAATTHISAGADVLTGTAQMVVGAIGKAKEAGALWFGTQSNQASLAPSIVVASQVYHWEVVLNQMIAKIKAGTLGGEAFVINLANGGERIALERPEIVENLQHACGCGRSGQAHRHEQTSDAKTGFVGDQRSGYGRQGRSQFPLDFRNRPFLTLPEHKEPQVSIHRQIHGLGREGASILAVIIGGTAGGVVVSWSFR